MLECLQTEMFRKAKQNRIFQDVVDQIQEAILDGRLKEGDRLPAERELCETFAVSRGTLREALRVLEQKGLITIKLGTRGGARVRFAGPEKVSESLALLIRSRNVSLRDLAEFRQNVEGAVSRMAAARAGAEDVRRLRGLLREAREHMQRGVDNWREFVRVDQRIHMALAEISGNLLFIFVLHSVHDNIHRYYERFLAMEEHELEENYRDLCAIVEAVARGRAASAAALAADHVRRFNRYMEHSRRRPES